MRSIVPLSLLVLALVPGCKSAPTLASAPPPGGDARSKGGSTRGFGDGGGASAPAGERVAEREDRGAAATESSPGLGTRFGEARHSEIVDVPFERGSETPDAVVQMRYDDFDGIRRVARFNRTGARTEARMQSGDGRFVVSVIDDNGNTLPAAAMGGETWVLGEEGQRWQLGVENHTNLRFEVVAAVDGLDVVDGGEAALHKRGYVLEPFSSMTIDGWRTSEHEVAAFRFTGLEDSYAARTGQARNVGVIGVAFFHEEGRGANEMHRRRAADPFPGRFARSPR
jgi:hypothetical protein